MDFLEKNWKWLVGVFLSLGVIGLTTVVISSVSKRSEEQAQEKFAKIEFDYTKYKEEFAKNSTSPVASKDDKKSAAERKNAEKALAESNLTIANARNKLVASLMQFISDTKKTIATEMASLYLSDLLLAENKTLEALEVLKKSESSSNSLTSVLIQKKIGSLLAENNQCEEALKVWDKLLKSSTANFAHSEVKIMQSLCYHKMNDVKKAEEILLSVKNDKTQGSADYAQHAERILRLIQFKKASGT